MQLARYPRPPGDTGLGFHYAPRRTAGDEQEIERCLSQLRSLGTSWLVLRAGLDQPLSEPFVRRLIAADIEPVVLIPVRPIRPIPQQQLRPLLRAYADYGVHYVCVYHQPNRLNEWAANDWLQPDLVARFMEFWTPAAIEIVAAGLYPVFPALVPGGHYWDTAFLAGALDELLASEARPLVDRLVIGIHNMTFNRPLSWGGGGKAKWRDARPYTVARELEDHRGFRMFEWYDEIVRSRIGYSLPVLAIASGAVLGSREDPRFPRIEADSHAEINAELAMMMGRSELPDYLMNQAFWVFSGGGGGSAESAAWFRSDGQSLPAVERLRDAPKLARVSRSAKAVEAGILRRPKPLHHYVLFPRDDGVVGGDPWGSAKSYIERFHPACGFDLEEAAQAEFVTLIGGPFSIESNEEEALREAGCRVDRIGDGDPRQTRRILDKLAKSGRRFLEF